MTPLTGEPWLWQVLLESQEKPAQSQHESYIFRRPREMVTTQLQNQLPGLELQCSHLSSTGSLSPLP